MLDLKGDTEKASEAAPIPAGSDTSPADRRPLLCRACNAVITHEDTRISVDGEHEHMRVNPAAFVYRFGCFSSAEGCLVSGDATDAHTWFTGSRWQYAHCRGCATHLGWYFTGEQSFFGLLLDRLVSKDR